MKPRVIIDKVKDLLMDKAARAAMLTCFVLGFVIGLIF